MVQIPLNTERASFKINFTIVGTQKGGTTALAHFLDKHPEIHVSPVKETHFFDRMAFFEDGQPDYSYYHSFSNRLKKQK